MANFAGYLLKSGDDVLNNKYIDWSSYDSSPKQREEIKAERDDNTRDLLRVTAAGMKTAIHFKTRDGLHLADKTALMNWFSSHYYPTPECQAQRRLSLTYWDDDSNSYSTSSVTPKSGGGYTGGFYLANPKFPIKHITDNDIIYGSVDIDLIEY